MKKILRFCRNLGGNPDRYERLPLSFSCINSATWRSWILFVSKSSSFLHTYHNVIWARTSLPHIQQCKKSCAGYLQTRSFTLLYSRQNTKYWLQQRPPRCAHWLETWKVAAAASAFSSTRRQQRHVQLNTFSVSAPPIDIYLACTRITLGSCARIPHTSYTYTLYTYPIYLVCARIPLLGHSSIIKGNLNSFKHGYYFYC